MLPVDTAEAPFSRKSYKFLSHDNYIHHQHDLIQEAAF